MPPVPGRFSGQWLLDVLARRETKTLTFTPDKIGAIKGAWSALSLNRMQALARRD